MAAELPFTPLGDLCDPERGITYGIVKVGEYVPGGVPVIRGGDIRDGRIVFNDQKRVTQEKSEEFSRTILRGGEIVINLVAEPGHSAIVPKELAGSNVSRDVGVIALGNAVDHRFVDYVLKSPAAIQWLTSRLQGSVTQKINLGTLRELPVPTPPISQQRAIARTLGALDDKIELNRRIGETQEAMARALFRSWFVDFEPVRAKAEGRDSQLPRSVAALFPESLVSSQLGEIPRGWAVATLGDLVETIKGCSYKSEELVESDIALVTLKSFARGGGYRSEGLKSFVGSYKANQQVAPGELVVACTDVTQAAEVIGRPAVVRESRKYQKLVASLDTLIVRPRTSSLTRAFLYFLAATAAFSSHTYSYTKGTTVLHLAPEAVPSFRFALPSSSLIEQFDSIGAAVLRRVQILEAESEVLGSLRELLLPRLITGDIPANRGTFQS